MCTALHADIERGALFNEDLKSLKSSMTEMKAQYQTSFGFGDPFPKDSFTRKKKVGKRQRRRPTSRGRWYGSQGLNRQQLGQFPFSPSGGQTFVPGGAHNYQGVSRGNFQGISRGNYQGVGRGTSEPASGGRGICYAFQAGECRRGTGCRYLHQSS